MSGVAIYMEGGGDGKSAKAAIRQGMDALLRPLKDAARVKALHWKLVPCGGRDEAFRGFRNAVGNGADAFVVLLVDAEGPVNRAPRSHLQSRDRWDMGFAGEDTIHLMVQVMETWIVADPDALSRYYGRSFNSNVLPKGENLEREPRADVERVLNQATDRTRKGRYHKIRHASDLLKQIDVGRVKARCPHCARLFDKLRLMIDAA